MTTSRIINVIIDGISEFLKDTKTSLKPEDTNALRNLHERTLPENVTVKYVTADKPNMMFTITLQWIEDHKEVFQVKTLRLCDGV